MGAKCCNPKLHNSNNEMLTLNQDDDQYIKFENLRFI